MIKIKLKQVEIIKKTMKQVIIIVIKVLKKTIKIMVIKAMISVL